MNIRTPTHFTESIHSGGSFDELFKLILIQSQVYLLHILTEAVKCALYKAQTVLYFTNNVKFRKT